MAGGIRAGQVSSVSAPPSGYLLLYPKSDNFWYVMDSTGAEYALGIGTVRSVTLSTSLSITPNVSLYDMETMINTDGLGTLTLNAPTGSPVQGQRLILRVKSTNAHTFSFNAIYRGSSQVALPTTLTGGSKTDYLQFIYNSTDIKWDLLGFNFGYT